MTLERTKTFFARIGLIALFVFAIYSNVGRVMKNNRLNEKLGQQKNEVASLKDQNDRLKELITYYQGASYQEVEARRRLAMKMPDETAIQLKNYPASNVNGEIIDQLYRESAPATEEKKTNARQWWDYFFNK